MLLSLCLMTALIKALSWVNRVEWNMCSFLGAGFLAFLVPGVLSFLAAGILATLGFFDFFALGFLVLVFLALLALALGFYSLGSLEGSL